MADITWIGLAKLKFTLSDATRNVLFSASRELFQGGEKIMTQSKRIVPVDKGPLRASGHVQKPVTTRTKVTVVLGYGGAAKDYALRQHEDESLNHPGQGEPHYLSKPTKAATRDISKRVAKAVQKAWR